MKKIIQRSTALLLLAVILLASTPLSAFAVSSGETVYISTTPRVQQNSDTGNDNANAPGVYWHNGNVSVRFITTRVNGERTGIYVYCVEPGASFVDNTYTAHDVSASTYWNSLGFETTPFIF